MWAADGADDQHLGPEGADRSRELWCLHGVALGVERSEGGTVVVSSVSHAVSLVLEAPPPREDLVYGTSNRGERKLVEVVPLWQFVEIPYLQSLIHTKLMLIGLC